MPSAVGLCAWTAVAFGATYGLWWRVLLPVSVGLPLGVALAAAESREVRVRARATLRLGPSARSRTAALAYAESVQARRPFGAYARWRLPRSRRRRPPVGVVGLVVAGTAFVATILAMSVLTLEGPGTRALQTRGATATATVVEARFSDGSTDAIHVSFDADGRNVVADLDKFDGIPSTERVGDTVEVLYDPRDPTYVIVDGQLDVADAQQPALATGCFAGLSLVGVAYWTFRVPRRRITAGF